MENISNNPILSDISSIVNQINLKRNSILLNPNESLETELQFGSIKTKFIPKTKRTIKNFQVGVTYNEFKNLMSYLKGKVNEKSRKTSLVTDKIYNLSYQESFRFETEIDSGKQRLIKKDRIYDSYQNGGEAGEDFGEEFGAKIALSKEKSITDPKELNKVQKMIEDSKGLKFEEIKPNKIRTKNRTSFIIKSFQVDLTEVDEVSYDRDEIQYSNQSFEVEMEVRKNTNFPSSNEFYSIFIFLFNGMKGTQFPYSQTLKNSVYSNINKILFGDPYKTYLPRSVLTEARDMKVEDLVYGGIVGNKSITPYNVTFKTDGKRYLLAILSSGVWLLMPGTSDLNRISMLYPKEYVNSLLDGELVNKSQMTIDDSEANNHFYIFDCLAVNGESKMNEANFLNRYTSCEPVIYALNNFFGILPPVPFILDEKKRIQEDEDKFIKPKFMRTLTKDFYTFNSVQEFYKRMNYMFLKLPDLPYMNDGLIFTPTATVYNPHSEKIESRSRVTTLTPDILKWKPETQRSIDLALLKIMNDDGTSKLYLQTYDLIDKTPVFKTFYGTNKHPINYSMRGSMHTPDIRIDSTNTLINDLPSGTVVEFIWFNNLLTPYRIRSDKPLPNKASVIEDIWNSIFEGVSEATLKGESFTLMKRYHNVIKRELLNKVAQRPSPKYLLDIGSGEGGDLGKWRGFDKILCIEPNQDHIDKLLMRLESSPIKNIVKVVKAGGEDTDIIATACKEYFGQKATIISFMLSLSFFDQKLDKLRDTIHQCLEVGGDLIFLTIDGNLVQQTFNPIANPSFNIQVSNKGKQVLNLNDAILEYDKETKFLLIDIPNSIVKDQLEKPPFINEILAVIPELLVIEMKRADEQTFLSESEKILTNMYTYGHLKLMDKPTVDSEVEIVQQGDDIVFISLITDELQILHGILKAFNLPYQLNNSIKFRKEMAQQLYSDIFSTNFSGSLSSFDIETIATTLGIYLNVNGSFYGSPEGTRLALIKSEKDPFHQLFLVLPREMKKKDRLLNLIENMLPDDLQEMLDLRDKIEPIVVKIFQKGIYSPEYKKALLGRLAKKDISILNEFYNQLLKLDLNQ